MRQSTLFWAFRGGSAALGRGATTENVRAVDRLPADLWGEIFAKTGDGRAAVRFGATCRRARALVRSPAVRAARRKVPRLRLRLAWADSAADPDVQDRAKRGRGRPAEELDQEDEAPVQCEGRAHVWHQDHALTSRRLWASIRREARLVAGAQGIHVGATPPFEYRVQFKLPRGMRYCEDAHKMLFSRGAPLPKHLAVGQGKPGGSAIGRRSKSVAACVSSLDMQLELVVDRRGSLPVVEIVTCSRVELE